MTSKLIRGFFYQELAADGLSEGKPFEALTIGSFVDMSGQAVEITLDRLKRIFANTVAALQAKRDSAGEIIGFPIDAKGHENGDAAGWIVGAELAGKVLKLVPRWTELGVEKISKKIQRLFSCTIDPSTDMIVGGSLTNWPAVKGLAPLELSQVGDLLQLALMPDESYDEAASRVMRAWVDCYRVKFPDAMTFSYPVNVYADYLVVRSDGQLIKVPYTDADGTITFADDAEWKPVRMVPVELAASQGAAESNMQQPAAEEIEMTLEELNAKLEANNQKLLAQFAALFPGAATATAGTTDATATPAAASTPAANAAVARPAKVEPAVATLVDLEGVRKKLESDMQSVLQSELDSIKARSANMFAATLAELHEKNRISEFARKMTDGTTNARALPAQQAKVEQVLLSLNPTQRLAVESLLQEAVSAGLVDFSERGTGGSGKQLKALPKEVAAYLDEGLKIEQLQTAVMKPVLADAGVTNLKEYDLSRWPSEQAKVHGAATAAQGAK